MFKPLIVAYMFSLLLVSSAAGLELIVDEEQTLQITDTKIILNLHIPRLQKIKVTLSDLPQGSDIMLGMDKWPHGGWRDNKGKETVSYEIDPKNTAGIVWIQVTSYGGISMGSWQGIRIVPNGPYFSVTQGSHPKEINGVKVLPVAEFKIKAELIGPKPETVQAHTGDQTTGPANKQSSDVQADQIPDQEDSGELDEIPEFYTFTAPWTTVRFEYPSTWQGGKDTTAGAAFIHSPDKPPYTARIFVGDLLTGASCTNQMIMVQDKWTRQGARLFAMNSLDPGKVRIPYVGVEYQLTNPENKNETKNMVTVTFLVPEQNGCRKVLYQVVKEDWETYFPVFLKLTDTLTVAGEE